MNIKIKVPFINSALYDEFYYNTDLWLAGLGAPFAAIRDWLQQFADVGQLYLIVYEFLFLATFTILYLKNKTAFRKMFFVTILIILLGSITYCLFPAIGPFYYADSPSPYIKEVQDVMMYKYQLYQSSNGSIYSPAQLIQGIAAMPSLHIANAFAFLFFIWFYARRFAILYVLSFLYIAVDAVYTKFHYSLDLVFGMILAIVCIYIGQKIYEKRKDYLVYDRDKLGHNI